MADWNSAYTGAQIDAGIALANTAVQSIPTASENAFGGVKADAKTAADTQVVRIGSDGKLYTAPGSSIGVYNNAGAHNSIYRGKYLGDAVTAAQWSAIGSGTFEDLYIGDYWTINNVNWRIAAFDYWLHYGDAECTTNHVVIVPDSNLLNGDGSTTHWLNATDTASGAYVNMDFYKGTNGNTGKAQCISMINSAFGSSHILTHREYFKNAITDGYESSGAWYDSTLEVMTEQMVYGCKVFGNVTNGTNTPASYTIDTAQLPQFALNHSHICNRANWWLRDVASASTFAFVDYSGFCSSTRASLSWVGIRPAFAVKA